MGKFVPKLPPHDGVIEIRGARQNNLKGFDLDLPLGKLIVVSGPSGCGKSSLAFDTVYAEGQRRYVETFSPYTRQFFERMDKPKVDAIRGIPPAIAIEQANSVKTTRSTVGTITEINDYLKQLLPRVVEARCPKCQRKVCPESAQSIAAEVFQKFAGERLLVTFGIPAPPGTEPKPFFEFIQAQGFLRVLIGGEILRLDEPEKVNALPAMVQVIQDRMAITEESRARLSEALETALRFGKGRLCVVEDPSPSSSSSSSSSPSTSSHRPSSDEAREKRAGDDDEDDENEEEGAICEPFSTGWHCAHCDLDIIPPTPGLFSFNNPQGACPRCRGFGRTIAVDLERALPDRRLSIADGVVKPFQTENGEQCQRDLLSAAKKRRMNVNVPFHHLSQEDQDWVVFGERTAAPGESLGDQGLWYGVKGFFDWLETKTYKMHVRVLLARYRTYTTCPDCRGGRYQVATMNFRWSGQSLPDLQEMPVGDLARWVGQRRAEILDRASTHSENSGRALKLLLESVESRLRYLADVGLGYLTLDRTTKSLSGGELERVNLTTCLGASLVNTLFVLDEPSVGLHPRDTGRLIRIMRQLRDRGNTLLVVEHEEAVLRAADHLVELGPGRGAAGGDLVYSGPLDQLPQGKGRRNLTLTGEYLGGTMSIPVPSQRRTPTDWIELRGAREHNLTGGDFRFPLGVFGCVTGVSGSGKSTLVHSILYRKLQEAKGISTEEAPGECDELLGHEKVAQVVMVDQSPLSRTPRSSPAVYLGVFDAIRELFANTPDAQAQGFTASTFSFNSGNGRCERCTGSGFEKIEMQFLSDVYVRCPECEGRRYQAHVLKVLLQGKSIHQVLEMTVGEAIAFFRKLKAEKVAGPLSVLEEVGLGYLTLGQPLNVLSGGESQRLKLVERLTQRNSEAALLILDEPTTGLHFDDVATLMRVFDRLVEKGNSLLVIEHNTEVIKCADYVMDLGPEAGRDGGMLVAAGTPEEVAAVKESHTGRYLREALGVHRAVGAGQARHLQSESLASLDGGRPSKGATTSLYEVDVFSESELRVADDIAAYGRGDRDIVVHGAREHNLKNIDVTIPRDQMVVITGLSGSGKSTLAFDILFAEGQRRFLDSMSAYARQFVEQLEKPEVDHISGLPPTVAIEQRITRGGGKSTVATVTEVYHFLRLLWAKLGTQYCPKCDLPVEKQTLAAAVNKARDIAREGKVRLVAPLVKARKGFHTEVARWAERHGFEDLLVDGKWTKAAGMPKLERFREHTIDVLVKESPTPEEMPALINRALEIGKGTARLIDAKNQAHIVSIEMSCPGCGQSFEELDPRLFSFNSPHGWCQTCKGFGEVWKHYVNKRLDSEVELEMDQERQHMWLDEGEAKPCPECDGARINEVARHVRLKGKALDEIARLSSKAAHDWSQTLKFAGNNGIIAADILPEIAQRLSFMEKVGLDYLALGRSAKTLSGGESQRIRLAAQLGSTLRGVLYVLDEPTIGLHARDNSRLLDTLEALKGKGNSLVIVEHDEETMRRADHIIDLGPGAGREGGIVVAQGTLEEIGRMEGSTTGHCFSQPMQHPLRGTRRSLPEVSRWLELRGATLHNLKNVHVRVPVGRLTVLTGISGSGKSTLMRGALKPLAEEALRKPGKRRVRKKGEEADARGELVGLISKTGGDEEGTGILDFAKGSLSSRWKRSLPSDVLEAIYEVDQSPIGKTSRSTPATYIKVFDQIRELYAQMPLARMRGYTASRFSFNTEGGRCESCTGQGVIKIEMNFLPTTYLPCPECHGKRYNAATQEVLFNEKSIGDVMEMTLAEAAEFFKSQSKVHRPLKLLCDTGLGYLQLGQASPTLSGGEAQRLKLVTELSRGSGRTETARLKSREQKSMLYLLEEPTIGLHLCDVQKLLDVLHRLVDDGATVVVIEHHLNLIAEADYLIDIGPEAGAAGGEVVACGTPEQVALSQESRTASFLAEVLRAGKKQAKTPKQRKPRQAGLTSLTASTRV